MLESVVNETAVDRTIAIQSGTVMQEYINVCVCVCMCMYASQFIKYKVFCN